jgi:hypothetical protein
MPQPNPLPQEGQPIVIGDEDEEEEDCLIVGIEDAGQDATVIQFPGAQAAEGPLPGPGAAPAPAEPAVDVEAPPASAEAAGSTVTTTPYEDHLVDFGDRDDGMRRISNGELKTFKRCRRKWYLGYYRKLGLAFESPFGARALGTRVHHALSVWYVPDGVERGDPFETFEETVREDFARCADDPHKLEQIRKDAELGRIMLEGYFQWLAETGADEGLRVIASETKLEVDPGFGDNTRLIAKMDVRAVREQDNARLFIDHKTVGSLTEPTKMLPLDEQMKHYHLIEYLDLLASGHAEERTEGALYNMLKKVKRTERAKPPFYDRVQVNHNLDVLRSYWLRVRGEVASIVHLEQQLEAGWDHLEVAYPNPTRDCTWDCDFYHVCSMFDDGSRSEDYLAANFVVINPLKRYETTDRSHEA